MQQLDNLREVERLFPLGTQVRKKSGSSWSGSVVGYYSTALTPMGVAIESRTETGSVQIYPIKAIELIPGQSSASGG